jgi:hypothetical protein
MSESFYVAVCDECERHIDTGTYFHNPQLPRVVAARHARRKGHGEDVRIAEYEAEYAGVSTLPNWRPTYEELIGDAGSVEA